MVNNKEKNFVSAVVYVYNCEDCIKEYLTMISRVLSNNFHKSEIICVNDSSSDNSVTKINNLAKSLDGVSISILNMGFFQGLELSMNAGIDLAIGDYIFEFDNTTTDYQEELIMEVYQHAMIGYDIVNAEPNSQKRFSSKTFYRIFNLYSNSQYKLNTGAFRMLSRRAVNRVHSMCKFVPYRKALYSNCGLKLGVIKYLPHKTAESLRNNSQKKQRIDLAVDSLILFTNIAYKLSLMMILIMTITTIASATYAFFVFFNKEPVAGWTTTILFLSFSFFGVFLILAVIIKYLAILLNLVFKKQTYVVESIIKIND